MGVDLFVESLEGANCLVVPPASLIVRAIHNFHHHKALTTVVVRFPYGLRVIFGLSYGETFFKTNSLQENEKAF